MSTEVEGRQEEGEGVMALIALDLMNRLLKGWITQAQLLCKRIPLGDQERKKGGHRPPFKQEQKARGLTKHIAGNSLVPTSCVLGLFGMVAQ